MAFDEQMSEGDYARRRRWKRIRTSVTLLVLIGFVVGAAWYSWRNVVNDEGGEAAAEQSDQACAPGVPTAAPAPADIQVNIYNATDRNGLASAVARLVRERGFVVVDIDNDPLDREITGTAEVRSGPDQQAAAGLVASLVPGATYVPDERTDAVVDLVLGEAFEALADPAAPAPTASSTLPPCQPSQQAE
ncbi:LytR C-terminal domain-containing protein [Jiangella asiatica]|uniref:LytR family transcriptional regulator n=1 Tax=Jiangella asiatica TaxID=2530372 RepID=A0A4R5CF30_9ACTN|nr:LytR C-terminal domain-containing protein [Jiangella asiatica]TDD97546.1 LytR family transcriptional regulator [Jiangella asiatica]